MPYTFDSIKSNPERLRDIAVKLINNLSDYPNTQVSANVLYPAIRKLNGTIADTRFPEHLETSLRDVNPSLDDDLLELQKISYQIGNGMYNNELKSLKYDYAINNPNLIIKQYNNSDMLNKIKNDFGIYYDISKDPNFAAEDTEFADTFKNTLGQLLNKPTDYYINIPSQQTGFPMAEYELQNLPNSALKRIYALLQYRTNYPLPEAFVANSINKV